ncbi:MAG: Asp23/Gls24 family envelope stress response protein [Clostridia bacterium]|nr:Asp23/Gls24 family envelope stress response protein [Clostridia bacterium]
MAQKKETLPVKVDVDLQNGGTITYANEVIATIAGVAANEIDGIAGMCVSGGFSEILGRNRTITKGVKVEVGSQEAAVDLYIVVEYGQPIQKVAQEVQENVRKALESLTGLHVVRVDVHVQGVSFEKEKKAALTGIEAAKNPRLTEAKTETAPKAEVPVKEEAKEEPKEEVKEEAPVEEVSAEKQEDILNDEETFNEEVLEEQAQLDGEETPAQEAAPAEEEPAAETKGKGRKKVPGRKRC